MNPNQMNVEKAMVAQREFRDEARQSRRRAQVGRSRSTRRAEGLLGSLRRR